MKRGGKRRVHAVAFSFSQDNGSFTGYWAFVKGRSKDDAANKAVNLVVSKLESIGRFDQVEHVTGLTEDELADLFEANYCHRNGYLFFGISATELI